MRYMSPEVTAMLTERTGGLTEACKRFGVARLGLFGSAATDGFNPAKSDIDLLVEFTEEAREKAFDNYFGLREELQALFSRPVDLVTRRALRNPFLIREIEQSRRLLYASHA